MNGKRRLLAMAALGILIPISWSLSAKAQDLATMSIEDLLARAPDLSPTGLYTLAGRLFGVGRHDEAVVWFYIAQLRARFRLAVTPDLSPDGEPALYGALFETLGPQINGWAFGDIDRVAAQMKEALDWDSSHVNTFTPKSGHELALARVRSGLMAMRASVLARKNEIRLERTAQGLVNR